MELTRKRRRGYDDDDDDTDSVNENRAPSFSVAAWDDQTACKILRGEKNRVAIIDDVDADADVDVDADVDADVNEAKNKAEAKKRDEVRNNEENNISSNHEKPLSSSDDDTLAFLDRLGDELIVKIFSYLSMKDLLRSANRVNRKWHKLTQAPELWRHIVLDVNKLKLKEGMDYRPLLIDDDILAALTSLSQGILSIDLTDCNALSADALISMSSRCRHLRSLNLTRSNLPLSKVLPQIANNCRCLEEVVLDNCSLDDDSVRHLVLSCRRLWKLSLANKCCLSDGALGYIADFAPQLKFLSIDHRQTVSNADLITDAGLSRLVDGCPLLEHLNVSGLQGLTAKGILSLSRLRNLKALDVARVAGVTPSLSYDDGAAHVKSLTDALLAVVDANARLDSLNVSIVKKIDDAFVSQLSRRAKMLKQLFILDSSEMTDKSLEALADHCLQLTKLDVSWCPKLSDDGVRYLVSKRPSLRLLGLIRCDAVTDACVDELMESYPNVEFQTFTLGCRQLLMRAKGQIAASGVNSTSVSRA